MKAPLSDEIREILQELVECGGLVDHNQYTADQTQLLLKLEVFGLVKLSWRITDKGKAALTE